MPNSQSEISMSGMVLRDLSTGILIHIGLILREFAYTGLYGLVFTSLRVPNGSYGLHQHT